APSSGTPPPASRPTPFRCPTRSTPSPSPPTAATSPPRPAVRSTSSAATATNRHTPPLTPLARFAKINQTYIPNSGGTDVDGSPLRGGIAYFKRFRMEIDLNALPPPVLPDGYHWLPWDESLLEAHAEAKFQSFQDEIDSVVFPSLSSRAGCAYLMREITRKP